MLAPDLLRSFASWQFEQILVCGQRLLLKLQLALQQTVFLGLLSDFLLHLRSLIVAVLVLQIKGLGQCLQVILGVDEVLNRQLSKAEQLHEVCISHPLEVLSVQLSVG